MFILKIISAQICVSQTLCLLYCILSFLEILKQKLSYICIVQFGSVAQSYLTLCDPMDCSMPDFPVHHQLWSLLKPMSIDSVMPSNHLILYCPLVLYLQSFPASHSFLESQFFTSGGQNIGVSASTSVLPMNIQDGFLLGWTG